MKITNRLFATTLCCVAINFLSAQQWYKYTPTSGFDINAVAIPELGHVVIGGGREAGDSIQVMFQSADYGLHWNENAHDGLGAWNRSIAFSDALNGFAAGYDGRIVRSDDGGANWGYDVYPINRDLNKIVHVSGQTYFVAGGNRSNDSMQTILKTTNNGANWSVIYDQPGPWLRSIFFTDTLNGLAVGDSGVILSTSTGGTVWAPVPTPVQRDFNGVTFLNADTGFIVGGNTDHRTILKTIDGGTNWTIVTDVTGGILNDVSFGDSLVGYAVGDSATVLKTIDGGINWSPVVIDAGLNGQGEIRSVKFYNADFGAVGGKGGLLYVYLGQPFPYSIFRTDPLLFQSASSAILAGTVKDLSAPTNLYFEYDTSQSFTSAVTVAAVPSMVNDTLQHQVSASLGSLFTATTYYYRLKGVAGTHVYYGNVQSFNLSLFANYYEVFKTSYATDVTDTSAIFTGTIAGIAFGTAVDVSFQYGPTPALGRETGSNSVLITDTLPHTVSAPVGGLAADTVFYYYRLKVAVDTGVFYGDIRRLYTGLPEVPNWDFEHWQNSTVELPYRWTVLYDELQKVPGRSGNAIKISGKNGMILGSSKDDPNGVKFFNGAPFHYRPDSVSFYLNYYVETGDTAQFFLYMYSGSNTMAFRFFPFTGNSNGSFQRFSYAVPYNSGLTPDSIVIGFVTSRLKRKGDAFVNNYIVVDDISFGTGAPLVPNYNFENWFSYNYNKLPGWDYFRFVVASEPVNTPFVTQAFYNAPNDHAAEIHNPWVGGWVSDGAMCTGSLGPFYTDDAGFSLAGKHLALNGYYKYFPVNGDTMNISANLFKGSQLVGQGQFLAFDSVTSFTRFNAPIYYTDTTQIPDSASITVEAFRAPSRGLSRMEIDKLSFDGFRINATGSFSSVAPIVTDEVRVYPNPSANTIIVEWNKPGERNAVLQLLTVNGLAVKEFSASTGTNSLLQLNVADLESGLYFLRIQSGQQVFTKKVVVVK